VAPSTERASRCRPHRLHGRRGRQARRRSACEVSRAPNRSNQRRSGARIQDADAAARQPISRRRSTGATGIGPRLETIARTRPSRDLADTWSPAPTPTRGRLLPVAVEITSSKGARLWSIVTPSWPRARSASLARKSRPHRGARETGCSRPFLWRAADLACRLRTQYRLGRRHGDRWQDQADERRQLCHQRLSQLRRGGVPILSRIDCAIGIRVRARQRGRVWC
jgi:hypothetical protein